MNKAKTLLLSSALTISGLFAAQAQTSANDDKLIAMNDPVKTEMTSEKVDPAIEPALRQGGYGDAESHSWKNKMMVIYLRAPETMVEDMKVEAEKLHMKYSNLANPEHTDVVVFYGVNNSIDAIWGGVLMNGEKFKTKSGVEYFTPAQMDKYSNTLLKYYRLNHSTNTAAIKQSGTNGSSLSSK